MATNPTRALSVGRSARVVYAWGLWLIMLTAELLYRLGFRTFKPNLRL